MENNIIEGDNTNIEHAIKRYREGASTALIILKQLNALNYLTEDILIDAIVNNGRWSFFNSDCMLTGVPKDKITYKVAQELVKQGGVFIGFEGIQHLVDMDLIRLAINSDYKLFKTEGRIFRRNRVGYNIMHMVKVQLDLDMHTKLFEMVGDNLYAYADNKQEQYLEVKKLLVDKSSSNIKEIKLDKEIVRYFLSLYDGNDRAVRYLSEAYRGIEYAIEIDGKYIQYHRYPTTELYLKIVDLDWRNLKYVPKEKQTEKICMSALNQSMEASQYVLKETKKLNMLLGKEPPKVKPRKPKTVTDVEDYKSMFPADYYLVKVVADIADEDDIIKLTVVEGRDMKKLLRRKISTGFGNMDGSTCRVEDVATYKPITLEEYELLRKLGLDGLETGRWGIDW